MGVLFLQLDSATRWPHRVLTSSYHHPHAPNVCLTTHACFSLKYEYVTWHTDASVIRGSIFVITVTLCTVSIYWCLRQCVRGMCLKKTLGRRLYEREVSLPNLTRETPQTNNEPSLWSIGSCRVGFSGPSVGAHLLFYCFKGACRSFEPLKVLDLKLLYFCISWRS